MILSPDIFYHVAILNLLPARKKQKNFKVESGSGGIIKHEEIEEVSE